MNGGQLKGMPLADRLWTRVDKDQVGTGCWVWLGAKGHGGYGVVGAYGRQWKVHRLVLLLTQGLVVPEGKQVDHLCRNRACCNPSHLELVTPRENTRRSLNPAAAHARQTHCHRGHEYTPENTYVRNGGFGRNCRECKRIVNRELDARPERKARQAELARQPKRKARQAQSDKARYERRRQQHVV